MDWILTVFAFIAVWVLITISTTLKDWHSAWEDMHRTPTEDEYLV